MIYVTDKVVGYALSYIKTIGWRWKIKGTKVVKLTKKIDVLPASDINDNAILPARYQKRVADKITLSQ